MIVFDGETLQLAEHSNLARSGGELQVKRTHFWGLRGNSEIVSKPGFWTVQCVGWVGSSSYTNRPLLEAYLQQLDDWRGRHGVLQQFDLSTGSPVLDLSFEHATFEGFEMQALDGHRYSASPIKDLTGMLANAWFAQGSLRWTLLKVAPVETAEPEGAS